MPAVEPDFSMFRQGRGIHRSSDSESSSDSGDSSQESSQSKSKAENSKTVVKKEETTQTTNTGATSSEEKPTDKSTQFSGVCKRLGSMTKNFRHHLLLPTLEEEKIAKMNTWSGTQVGQ